MYPNLLGELIGTMVLIIFGDGVVANLLLKDSKGNGAGWVHICLGWAFAVTFGIFAAWSFGAGEADLNPAVTLFKGLSGVYPGGVPQIVATMIAELIGGILGGVIVYLMYSNHWAATEDPGLKLAVFSTGPARRNLPANVLTEVIATSVFIISIQAIFKGTTTSGGEVPVFMIPLLVGFLVFVVGAACGGPTGYSLNPARDMGPRIAHAILPIPGKGSNDWEFGIISASGGPFAGALVAFVLWKLVAGF
ncbi:MAG: aquaporin family protein [Synergistaceae bacterium]|jgi:glycerol uptake facilitator protein|nr:aquaporin family protein [Synergistaceae bacterium]